MELCAGGGGQTIGLERAGFECVAAGEIDSHACNTLRLNRPGMRVLEGDIKEIRGQEFSGVDMVSAGVPCPPFSIAGKQLGAEDDRDLFPEALRIVRESAPRAVMLENVPGFAALKFQLYRQGLISSLKDLGYAVGWRVLQAANYGVPQLRPRFILIAMRPEYADFFRWPAPLKEAAPTVGETLYDLMAERGWAGAADWRDGANEIAPTVVGGSKKHGGPDLGPTRAKAKWRSLGVDGMGIANEAPGSDVSPQTLPRLTVRMVARLQSFPDTWEFSGKKTASYRQIGNAFPPLVAQAVATAVWSALQGSVQQQGLYPESQELVSGLVSEA